jgi:hypothetical protein
VFVFFSSYYYHYISTSKPRHLYCRLYEPSKSIYGSESKVMTTSSNKMMKALITTLAADNSNQAEFLTSVKMVAGQLGATSFLTRNRSRSRKATRVDLMRQPVKSESKKNIKNESGSSSDDDDADEAAKKSARRATRKAQRPSPGDLGSPTNPITVDNSPLEDDDVEAAILGDYPLFLRPGSDTEIESTADNVIRMKMFQQLTLATPLHLARVRSCKVGDCYGIIKRVLKDIIVTGQSLYHSVIALSLVKFDSSITVSELDTALKEAQTKANRLKPDVISEDIMRGAVLSLAQKHSNFSQLATELSKQSVTSSYDDIICDLLQHESNTASKPTATPPRAGVANAMTDANLTQLAAALTLAINKAKPTGKPSQEACRNFSRGKCTRDDCRYSHSGVTPPGIKSTSTAPPDERKRITCYNCQKVGYHRASECTAPKEERRRPRGATGQEANHTEDKSGEPRTINVAAFMEQLTRQAASRQPDDKDGGECAHACIDYDLDLDAVTRGPNAAQEQAARMYGSMYCGDVTADGALRNDPELEGLPDLMDSSADDSDTADDEDSDNSEEERRRPRPFGPPPTDSMAVHERSASDLRNRWAVLALNRPTNGVATHDNDNLPPMARVAHNSLLKTHIIPINWAAATEESKGQPYPLPLCRWQPCLRKLPSVLAYPTRMITTSCYLIPQRHPTTCLAPTPR